MAKRRTSLIVGEGHPVMREGLVAILRRHSDLEVVAEVPDGEQALAEIESRRPAVAILDLRMRLLSGIEVVRKMRDRGLATICVLLAIIGDEKHVPGAIDAGATGVVLKECAPAELRDAVRAAARSQIYISPALAGGAAHESAKAPTLSERERDVLRLICHGLCNKEVAAALSISVRTVEGHRAAIMDRLGIRNLPGLVKYAIAQHITPDVA